MVRETEEFALENEANCKHIKSLNPLLLCLWAQVETQ
jgi:hypothetical protein